LSGLDFAVKTINDPVHGSIKLSSAELAVIDTPTFQRLRGLKQLGLADLAFPGATHTRFAHSIGVLHIVSQMLDAIERNYRNRTKEVGPFSDQEKQKIRLAALLHDVGHLPLSHAMEYPIQRLIKEQARSLITEKSPLPGRPRSFGPLDDTANAPREKDFKHENFGRDILIRRSDISAAIKEFNPDNEIGNIFTKDHIDNFKYSQFVTGTLDADRLDFLLRDSLAAGVSYGNIDLKYLLDNFQYDKDTGQFYIDYSGIHALEHFITSRFFLYNVTYHKTVMGFELLAKHAYYRMARDGKFDIISSKAQLYELLDDTGRFLQFDDYYFWRKLREWPVTEPLDVAVRDSLLLRHPVRELFAERELTDSVSINKTSPFRVLNSQLYNNLAFDQLLDRHHIARSGLAVLTNGIDFEESAPTKERSEQPDIKQEWALCKVFYDDEIKPLIDVPGSIIQKLSFMNLKIRRLYYLPLDSSQSLKRDEIRKEVRALAAES
jgi:HD superfamily phosphohydrolase